MNSRAYWSLIFYGIFCRIMFAGWEGWMDALSTVLWLGVTIYLAYNMQWSAYGASKLTNVEPVVRKVRGKTKVTLRCTYARQDAVQDVGFWLIWLGVFFILELFHLTVWVLLILLLAFLIIVSLAAIAHVANRARPMYNRLVAWFIYLRARFRHFYERHSGR